MVEWIGIRAVSHAGCHGFQRWLNQSVRTYHQSGYIQTLDGGVMVLPAQGCTPRRRTHIGLMLAAVVIRWEDRNWALALGKRRPDRTAGLGSTSGAVGGLCRSVPAGAAPIRRRGTFHFEIEFLLEGG